MKKRLAALAILAFSFLGLANSAYLTEHELNGTPLLCNINNLSGCNIVAQSPYSHLFGISLAEYGLGFYGLLFLLSALELALFDRRIRRALQAVAAFGVLASLYFTFLQVFVISALCIYCMISALLALLIFLAASLIEPLPHRPLPGMRRFALLAPFLLLITLAAPSALAAPSYLAGKDLIVATSSPGNVYLAGASVAVSAPVAGDLSAVDGTIVLGAPVAGDALLLGGIESVRAAVAGDLRVAGGRVSVEGRVGGDLVAFAGSFSDSGSRAKSIFVAAGNANIIGGASGPVVVYADNVTLGGTFTGGVRIVAAGRVILLEKTRIEGALDYEAAQVAVVPASATVVGGAHYTGASYLPTAGEARALALAGIGVFLFVKVLGALILAGLVAGLFPRVVEAVAERALRRSARSVLLTTLLGFAIIVATPVLLVLLAVTFVGLGVALALALFYALLIVLAVAASAAVLGSAITRRLVGRSTILWHDAVIGMLVLSLIALVPLFGLPAVLLLLAFSTGALASLAFHLAFPHEEQVSLTL